MKKKKKNNHNRNNNNKYKRKLFSLPYIIIMEKKNDQVEKKPFKVRYTLEERKKQYEKIK